MVLLALLATACSEAPESDLKLVTIESPAAVGLSLRELPPSVLKSVGLPYGLVVVRADGMASTAGLRMGDVVFEVNQQRLRSVDDFRKAVTPTESSAVRLHVRRGKLDFYVTMAIGGTLPRPDGGRPAPGSKETLLRT
jgi:S1-C subfamily serine protease